jgi:hypothetical protein
MTSTPRQLTITNVEGCSAEVRVLEGGEFLHKKANDCNSSAAYTFPPADRNLTSYVMFNSNDGVSRLSTLSASSDPHSGNTPRRSVWGSRCG